jgi:hypothetical protein
MNDEFITFQRFNSIDLAQRLISVLETNSIPFEIENTSATFDLTFTGNLNHEYRVKIRSSDMERTNLLLDSLAVHDIEEVDLNHYLISFSDKELLELVEKPDQWSKEDYHLALKILGERGLNISQEQLDLLKQKRIRESSQMESGNSAWLILGLLTAIVGGAIGILIGWTHWKSTKTNLEGREVYSYDSATRKIGKLIFAIGCIFALFYIILFLNFLV